MKRAITIAVIVVTMIGIVISLIAYSYTQIQIHLDNVSFGGFDWATASLMTLAKLAFNALTGNLIGTVLSLITGVKLNLIFSLSNHGILPVYIPDLSYNLSVNGVNVGQGQSTVDMTINPGETKNLPVLQDFQISSLEPAATSVLEAGGIMNIQVSGTAHFKFLGLTIPVPFQSTKQVNVVEEAKNRFLGTNSQNSGNSAVTNQPTPPSTTQNPSQSITIADSVYKVGPGTYRYVTFYSPCSSTVTGSFSAQAALGNNIIVYLMDENNFNIYKNGNSAQAYYNSGKVESGNFNVSLASGTYYIIMSNTYSTISTKTVSLYASYACN